MVKLCYDDVNKTIGANCGFLFSNTGTRMAEYIWFEILRT